MVLVFLTLGGVLWAANRDGVKAIGWQPTENDRVSPRRYFHERWVIPQRLQYGIQWFRGDRGTR